MFPILTIASLLQCCAPAKNTTLGSTYQEDLSIYREENSLPNSHQIETDDTNSLPSGIADIEPIYHIKSELDTVLSRIVKSRKGITTVGGYSIQLYTGNNRDKASQIKARTYELSKGFKPKITYEQPNYKVRVGSYYSRLEAHADLVRLQAHFSRAVLIPSRIQI